MACRDYEYDYEHWLSRSSERLAALRAMLREVCDVARRQGIEVPRPVTDWLASAPVPPLSREHFDGAVQMLCLMCQTADEHGLSLPPSVHVWWTEHKVRDEQEELAKGLSPTPIYSDFWQEHAAKMEAVAQFPGVNHADALKALEAAGCRVVHEGRHITMEKDGDRFLIPRDNPVNAFAMAAIVRRVGLTDEQFRELLQQIAR